jgi:hypothetical protein
MAAPSSVGSATACFALFDLLPDLLEAGTKAHRLIRFERLRSLMHRNITHNKSTMLAPNSPMRRSSSCAKKCPRNWAAFPRRC